MYYRRFFTLAFIAMLALCPLVSAQEDGDKGVMREGPAGHHEVRGDAYTPVEQERMQTSPAFSSSSRGFFMTQVNINLLGNNIIGDAGNEPSLAIDPTNPDRMVIGWRQFDTISSDFRQAGWGYTSNGGQNWFFPGRIEAGIFRSDPVLDVDSSGTFYYNSLTTDDVDFWCHVFKSTDGGATWDTGTYAYGGDKQWMVIDKTGGVGDGNIYAHWTDYWSVCYPGMFTRSTNGGASYESCITVTGSPYWGTPAIGPDGELYVCGDGFTVTKSSNAKYAAQSVSWDFSRTVSLDGSMGFSGGPNPGGLLGQTWIAVDSSGGPTNGNVYLLCSVSRNSTSDPMDVMFARSTDGGNTWSAPVRVNDDPGTSAYQWFGTMSVAPNGRIDVVWLDTRDDPGGYDSALFYSYSEDGGVSWAANEQLTTSFDPHVGWPVQNKMGDYFHMISDNDGAHLAFAGTYNGEQDVYYANITRSLSISVPNGAPELIPPGQPYDITVRINPGNENYVSGTGAMYYRYDGGTWQSQLLTAQGGDLYQGTLPAAGCSDTPEFYFSAEGDQSGVVTDPHGAPGSVYSATVGEVTVFYSEPMDTNPGWTISGSWAFGQPTGGGGSSGEPDPTSGYTGSNVYGYNLNGDYTANMPEQHLTSTAIDCTGQTGVALSYRRWLGVETSSYDHAYLRISNNGTTWNTLWQNSSTLDGGAWEYREFDISAHADNQATVYLRWTMGTTDTSVEHCGWNIDDVELSAFGCQESGSTLTATFSADPASGTLPFSSSMSVSLENNYSGQTRRLAGRIDVDLAGGQHFSNWKSGWSNVAASSDYSTVWNQNFPVLGNLVGDNVFQLVAEDVTPAPFNQPPHPPAGDTDTDTVTVTGVAP